jgi:hypothetical protein
MDLRGPLLALLASTAVLACGSSASQDDSADEESGALTQGFASGTRVATTTRVRLRSAPSMSASSRVLEPRTPATVMDGTPQNGFYRIRLDAGPEGWTFGAYLVALDGADAGPEAGVNQGTSTNFPTTGDIFRASATGYYPDSSQLEGGFLDTKDQPLHTLQDFLAGRADQVSIAMDSTEFPYGQRLRIKELERKYGRVIDFRVVDTGGDFVGKGRTRLDVCVQNYAASIDDSVNGLLTIAVVR